MSKAVVWLDVDSVSGALPDSVSVRKKRFSRDKKYQMKRCLSHFEGMSMTALKLLIDERRKALRELNLTDDLRNLYLTDILACDALMAKSIRQTGTMDDVITDYLRGRI